MFASWWNQSWVPIVTIEVHTLVIPRIGRKKKIRSQVCNNGRAPDETGYNSLPEVISCYEIGRVECPCEIIY